MNERKAGWYWVRPDDENDPWETAHWSGKRWSFMRTRQQSERVALAGPRIPTPDEPWQCVPSNGSTEQMDDAARGFLLMLSMRSEISYERLRQELKMRGEDELIESLPDYAQTGEGHMPKAAQADILFRLMLAAAPKPEDV
tara:strand:+ start:246 stop:668 length:423 start_codon:yes stop_codon:yes gene_type:complete